MNKYLNIEFKDKKFLINIVEGTEKKIEAFLIPEKLSAGSIDREDIFNLRESFDNESFLDFNEFIKNNLCSFDNMIEDIIPKSNKSEADDFLYNLGFIHKNSLETCEKEGLKIIIKTLFLEFLYKWFCESEYLKNLNLPFNEVEFLRILLLFKILKLMISEETKDFLPSNTSLNDILKLNHFKSNYIIWTLDGIVEYICLYADNLEYIYLSPDIIKKSLINIRINEIFNNKINKDINQSLIERIFDIIESSKVKDLTKVVRKFQNNYLTKIVAQKSIRKIDGIIEQYSGGKKESESKLKIKRITESNLVKAFHFFVLILPMLFLLISQMLSTKITISPFIESMMIILIIFFSIIKLSNNDEKLSDFPRIFGSLVVGYSLLLVGDEIYTYVESLTSLQILLLSIISIIIVVIFIKENIKKYFVNNSTAISKALYLYYRVYIVSLTGIYVLSPLVISNFIINKSANYPSITMESYQDLIFKDLYLRCNVVFNYKIMIIFPILAVMIGVFLQLLWEDSEIVDKI